MVAVAVFVLASGKSKGGKKRKDKYIDVSMPVGSKSWGRLSNGKALEIVGLNIIDKIRRNKKMSAPSTANINQLDNPTRTKANHQSGTNPSV